MQKNDTEKEQKLNINANSSGVLEVAEYFNKVKTTQPRERGQKAKHKPKAR